MAAGEVLVAFAVLFSLQLIVPADSQIVVENDKCLKYHLQCGLPKTPTSQKYCCAESDGGIPRYSCCNPYIGLFIGIGVSVPVIVLLIVLCCVLYIVYAHYRRKKLRALLQAYSRRRSQEERTNSSSFVAPPPYTPFDNEEESHPSDSELPAYSVVDQFDSTALTITHTSSTEQGTPLSSEQNVASESTAAQTVVETETSEIPLEDVPLLSDDDNQS